MIDIRTDWREYEPVLIPEYATQRAQTAGISRADLSDAALMATEGVTVGFAPDGIAALARIAAEVNAAVENIGARRLYTVIERVFEELSFSAPDKEGETVQVDAGYVERHLGDLARSTDLSRYVL